MWTLPAKWENIKRGLSEKTVFDEPGKKQYPHTAMREGEPGRSERGLSGGSLQNQAETTSGDETREGKERN